MELTNTFDVSAPIDTAWAKLTDLHLVAPLFPGATLDEVAGDEHRGALRVEVGPTTATYQGTARIIERDEASKRLVIDATGRDTSGDGNVGALMTAQLSEADGGTQVELVTDLTLTGDMAQLARGVLSDASANLIGQFVENVEREVFNRGSTTADEAPGVPAHATAPTVAQNAEVAAAAQPPGDDSPDPTSQNDPAAQEEIDEMNATSDPDEGEATEPAVASATTDEPEPEVDPGAEGTNDEPAAETGGPDRADGRQPAEPHEAGAGAPLGSRTGIDATDLLDAGGVPLAKRVLPAVGALGLLLLIIRILRGRSK